MPPRPEPSPAWKPIGRTFNTHYYWADDDMLIALADPGLEDDEPSARENLAFQTYLAHDAPRRGGRVVYLGSLRRQSLAARRIYARLDPSLFLGTALVVSSPLARTIGSLVTAVTRPELPTRLVGSIDEGLRWLAGLRRETA